MRTVTFLLAMALAGECAALPVTGPLDLPRGEETAADRQARRERSRVSELSEKYDADPREVRSLRARGMGWPEVERILDLSRRAGQPSAGVAESRESGMSWEEIEAQYGLAPKPPIVILGGESSGPRALWPWPASFSQSLHDALNKARNKPPTSKAPGPQAPAPPAADKDGKKPGDGR